MRGNFGLYRVYINVWLISFFRPHMTITKARHVVIPMGALGENRSQDTGKMVQSSRPKTLPSVFIIAFQEN